MIKSSATVTRIVSFEGSGLPGLASSVSLHFPIIVSVLFLPLPPGSKLPDFIMLEENEIVNQNADGQEGRPVVSEATEAPTATTNAPVENPVAGEEPIIPATQPAETAFATPHDDF